MTVALPELRHVGNLAVAMKRHTDLRLVKLVHAAAQTMTFLHHALSLAFGFYHFIRLPTPQKHVSSAMKAWRPPTLDQLSMPANRRIAAYRVAQMRWLRAASGANSSEQ